MHITLKTTVTSHNTILLNNDFLDIYEKWQRKEKNEKHRGFLYLFFIKYFSCIIFQHIHLVVWYDMTKIKNK